VLDAQWFGVPQRRRRIFALSDFGNWRDRGPILFERESLCGNPTPRRKEGEGTAADAEGSTVYENHAQDSRVKEVKTSPTVHAKYGMGGGNVPLVSQTFSTPALGDVREDEIASTMQAKTGSAGETQNPAYVATYRKSRRAQSTTDHESWVEDDVANTINTFDVGDVRSTNAVAYRPQNFGDEGGGYTEADVSNSLDATQGSKQTHLAVAFKANAGFEFPSPNDKGDLSPALQSQNQHAIAVRTAQTSANGIGVSDVAHTLDRAQGQAVAFTASERSNSYAWESEVNPTLNSQIPNDTSNLQYGIRQQMQVRRLTPVECCRLQGFPDDHLDITYRNKPAPDGAKYKALGNSMAVPVIRWIGERISSV
jgi:DNA (cytosine-5)-methyltransferase 1